MALYYTSPTRNLPDGYSFRGATLKDLPFIAVLFNQRHMISTNSQDLPIAEMRREWQSTQINPAIDVRVVLDQREHLIGYIEVWTTSGLGAHPWVWGCVHPDYEGRGIGTALLRWAEARVRLSMELLPSHLRVAPRFGAQHTLSTAPALCRALGWQPMRADEGIVPQAKNLTSAVRLLQAAGQAVNSAFDVYEKEIRPGDEFVPQAV